jgi:hypothetical protein
MDTFSEIGVDDGMESLRSTWIRAATRKQDQI